MAVVIETPHVSLSISVSSILAAEVEALAIFASSLSPLSFLSHYSILVAVVCPVTLLEQSRRQIHS